MNAITAQRRLQKALITPLALGGLLLTVACGGDDGAEDTTEGTTTDETSDDTADDSNAETDGDAETSDEDGTTEEDNGDTEDESSDETSEDDVLSMDEVEANNTADSCWAVMDDTVYDLTDWIDQHPGGEQRIEQLCGTDATDAFEEQHGGSDGPENQLTEFEIGPLDS